MKRAQFALPILALLLLTACQDDTLKKVADGLNATAQGISVVQTTVIQANTQKLITDADTTVILKVCAQVNQAGKDAVAITRTISKLDQPTTKQLLTILTPVIAAINNAIDSGLAGIKDPATVSKVRAALLTVQTTLNAIQLALAGG